jgi:protein SCO1/2
MKRATLGLLLGLPFLLGASGCDRVRASNLPYNDLPYYENGDFTPNWTGAAHRVGRFSLVAQDGAPLTDRDLAGHVHVASFIYTRCSAICPMLVASLKKVQAATTDLPLVIVSYSVTPDLDSPAVLATFGRERGIDPARWKLVTGDKSQIYRLARESYFASDERLGATLAQPDAFLHTEKLVLVDREGRLRGVYNGTQPFDIDHLIADARTLTANR